jgi:DNA-binding NarL/FixJ family response regulator
MLAILSKAIHILLVSDCIPFCAGLRALIENQQGVEIIGEARSRADALAIIARECPDIILLNLDLDSENDLDLLRELLAAARESRIVILAGRHSPAAYYRAVRLGALGIVLKEQIVECLSVAIKEVHAGKAWLDGAIMAKVLYCLSHGIEEAAATDSEAVKLSELTEREQEIVALVTKGLKNQQIADRLFISEGTVRNHLTVIFAKLGIFNRCELIAYAYQRHLADRHLQPLC